MARGRTTTLCFDDEIADNPTCSCFTVAAAHVTGCVEELDGGNILSGTGSAFVSSIVVRASPFRSNIDSGITGEVDVNRGDDRSVVDRLWCLSVADRPEVVVVTRDAGGTVAGVVVKSGRGERTPERLR